MMRKRIIHSALFLFLLAALFGCRGDWMEPYMPGVAYIPEGEPVTLYIPFSGPDPCEVTVGTKAEAAEIDETRIHDLYVMVFDNTQTPSGSAKKIYGRFFSYDHMKSSPSALQSDENECWYVENKDITGTVAETNGAVKISTISCSDATLFVIANVVNSVINFDGMEPLQRLKDVQSLDELRGIQVCLGQDVVNRKDLFLMTGKLDEGPGVDGKLHTGDMSWGTLPKNYNADYRVTLTPVDAKVKFRVKVNPKYISAVTPVYWQVCNTPDRCYLDSSWDGESAPEDILHFASQQYYFEGSEEATETDPDTGDPVTVTYYTFCFYILENRQTPNGTATQYFQRELRDKIDTGESGYKGPTGPASGSFSDHFVENGNWAYAPTYGTYVQFDLVLTLTEEGIDYIGGEDPESLTIGHALTSDAIFTVHLGDFDNSSSSNSARINDYKTERGHFYTYNITVKNTKSIYTEVTTDNEVQAGQEGFLLLTDSEIINADCHYEYHQISFPYRPDMNQRKFSWYVKTPFGEGGPTISIDEGTGNITYDASGLDYLWVKFGLNDPVTGLEEDSDGALQPWYSEDLGGNVSPYSRKRHMYPGDNHYDPNWAPGSKVAAQYACNDPNRDIPDLMDITQLIRFVFYETGVETDHRKNSANPSSAFIADNASPSTTPVMRFTAYIDEYYYEEHPIEHTVDPDLWRKFVNAQPRELHILSDARQSRDRKSDVILSSHSVIQQSIQTIYNIYAADLTTLWGTEHIDENRNKSGGWAYWPGDLDAASPSPNSRYGDYNTELGKWNGRLNSAYIWDFYSSKTANGSDRSGRRWDTYLDYNVHNDVPELVEAYQGMAYSCLSRNRDNNGNGVVDRSEVRWYLAACNQLVGMWVGNESLSIGARLYNPAEGQWRAHILSSTDRRVCWSEEGGGATIYEMDYNGQQCWTGMRAAAAGESVRCLRNIGTYNDGGTLRDISYAPYSQEIDHYFTKEGSDPAGPYTFYFDRLNPKSIREYSDGELPYANQFNISNCVYLKLEAQNRADNVGDTAEDRFDQLNTINNPKKNKYPTIETINKEVTALGYNPYCPPGYRFPNHTEMVLMSLYLPNAYFDHDKDNNAYSGTMYMPSRTYYNRGLFEKDESRGMTATEIANEQRKVGWGYSTNDHKPHCAYNTQAMQRTRCVRDVQMTGWIDGDIMMSSPDVCNGDPVPLTFSFFSSGAAFVSAALKLCYTDGSGVYHERDIPVQKTPTGLQFLADQTVSIPTIAEVGLSEAAAASAQWKFKLTLRNAATSRTFEKSFGLVTSHLTRCSISLPSESDPDKGMPVRVNIGMRNRNATITNVTIHWKSPEGSWQTEVLEDGSHNLTSFEGDAYLSDLIGDSAWATEANRYKEYQFYATASCSDGSQYVSETVSNEILRLNYTPNPVPAGGWTNISQCQTTWYNNVSGLDFSAGDYIEADMDLSNCRYKYLTGNANTDLGQDNLIGFSYETTVASNKGINNINTSVIWYYPSVQNLVNNDDPSTWGWIRSRVHAGQWNAYTPDEGVLYSMNLILDKDGLIRDGSRFTHTWSKWATVKANLAAASAIQLGSTEGSHKSRATYNYVRVVRVKADAVPQQPRD